MLSPDPDGTDTCRSASSEDAELELALRLSELADLSAPFALATTATLGITDVFEDRPRSLESAADEAGCNPEALRQLLRVLVAREVFSEPEPGVFALSAMARLLLDTHPQSLRAAYELMPADIHAWGHLKHSLETGQGSFEQVHGRSLWQYLEEDSEASARFDRAMAAMSGLEVEWLLDAYDWQQLGSIVDVGGGDGSFLVALLEEAPALRGVLFDLPQVVARAIDPVRAGLGSRYAIEGGDFFAGVPAGHGGYVLKRIVYSYDDQAAGRILRQIRAAMTSDSRLLLLEPVQRHRGGPAYTMLLDLQMLILGGGRVRDRHALRALLRAAGLRLRRVIPTPMVSIVEALPE